ncbi:MAG: SMC-Scp complex subunit ScpB [Lachnospiraceae bacterium]|nr:SMC-Scp complex subunit ScpB [Lachnospiraceae bacterium]MCR4732699.1 SMC-Scp complex subunit ScpB [Lachnospiraceae bacterium]
MEKQQIRQAVEGVLFTMGGAVSVDKMATALEVDPSDIRTACDELATEYKESGRGISIVRFEDSYQMCTSKETYPYLIRIAKQPKKVALTDVLLETLSIIAYRQPVTKAAIEKIRGVSSDHAVNKLVEYELVEEVGRMDAPGRPMLFGTTEQFLRSFGVNSLSDLPSLSPVQVEEFKEEAEREADLEVEV